MARALQDVVNRLGLFGELADQVEERLKPLHRFAPGPARVSAM
jgi:hypothetical protein